MDPGDDELGTPRRSSSSLEDLARDWASVRRPPAACLHTTHADGVLHAGPAAASHAPGASLVAAGARAGSAHGADTPLHTGRLL